MDTFEVLVSYEKTTKIKIAAPSAEVAIAKVQAAVDRIASIPAIDNIINTEEYVESTMEVCSAKAVTKKSTCVETLPQAIM